MVLGAPFILVAASGCCTAPTSSPSARRPARPPLAARGPGHHARGSRSATATDVEHVTRVMAPTPYVALHPPTGAGRRPRRRPADDRGRAAPVGPAGAGRGAGLPDHRLGRLPLGAGAACTATALRVLPHTRAVRLPGRDPAAGRPGRRQPLAAARGRHRVRRHPAVPPGDRLRRISWRVSVRSRELHVTTSPAEEDSGVLLVVDALGDHGHSGGLDGEAEQPRPERPGRGRRRRAPHPCRRPGRAAHRRRGRRAARVRRRHPAPAGAPRPAGRGPRRRAARGDRARGSSSG